MPLKIRVNSLNKKRKINTGSVKRLALRVLGDFRRKNALVDITFVTDKKIKALNKRYMRRNAPTDVISFSLKDERFLQRKILIGDIYISSDMASENAKHFGSAYEEEISLYVIHGLLHLIGFDDKAAEEKNKIRELERKLLKKTKS